MKYIQILCIVWILQSCTTVTLSELEVNNITSFQVKIMIEDGGDEKSLNKIAAYLSDGEKKITNQNIKILCNDEPLDLFVRIGNYYDKYPVYTTDDLLKRASYYFEMVLPNGRKHPLAFIKPVQNDSVRSSISENDLNYEQSGLISPKLKANSEILYSYSPKRKGIQKTAHAKKK